MLNLFILRISAAIFLFTAMAAAGAQDMRSVSLVVPFAAGSAQDILARLISEPLGQALHARVLVVNKPGAGGTIGAAFVAQAKPNGETLLMASSGHHLAGAMYPRLSYHPVDSFRAVAFTGSSDFVLVTASSMASPDLATFVAQVKAQPNGFNYASAGAGSTTHVGMASFLSRANLQMLHLPLKGTNEVINELLSGRVQAAMVSAFSIHLYKADPRLQLLASTDTQKSEQIPELPTLHETGYPHFKWTVWTGVLAPAGTATSIVQDINRAVTKAYADPQIQKRFQQMGIAPRTMSVAQFDGLLREDWQKTTAQLKQSQTLMD